jgi:hypothetical protein
LVPVKEVKSMFSKNKEINPVFLPVKGDNDLIEVGGGLMDLISNN